MDFVAPVPKLRQHISREHFGVAACDIEVEIIQFHQAEYGVNESYFCLRIVKEGIWHLRAELDFVNKDVITFCWIGNARFYIGIQLKRVPIPDVVDLVQGQLDNLILRDAGFQQIIFIEMEKQKRFAATTEAGNDFYSSVVLLVNQSA